MEISEIFYPKTRAAWRTWLETHHTTKSEIWFRTPRKDSGEPSVSYDDMVEECLCFGWIDGVAKKDAPESMVRRITPRKKRTFLSELNRQRIWKLQKQGRMTPAGIAPVADQIGAPDDPWEMPSWIAQELCADAGVWEKWGQFPHFYQRLKMGWIMETAQSRADEIRKRLDHLKKMTAQGKMYGTQPMLDILD